MRRLLQLLIRMKKYIKRWIFCLEISKYWLRKSIGG